MSSLQWQARLCHVSSCNTFMHTVLEKRALSRVMPKCWQNNEHWIRETWCHKFSLAYAVTQPIEVLGGLHPLALGSCSRISQIDKPLLKCWLIFNCQSTVSHPVQQNEKQITTFKCIVYDTNDTTGIQPWSSMVSSSVLCPNTSPTCKYHLEPWVILHLRGRPEPYQMSALDSKAQPRRGSSSNGKLRFGSK